MTNLTCGDKFHLTNWSALQIDLTSWLRLVTLPSCHSSIHLTGYNLSSWLVKLTWTIVISRKCRTLTLSVSKFDPAIGVKQMTGPILHGGNLRWQDRFCTVKIEPRVLMACFRATKDFTSFLIQVISLDNEGTFDPNRNICKNFFTFSFPKRTQSNLDSLKWNPSIERVETSCAEQIFSDEITWIRNEVKPGDQAVFEMKSLDSACGKWSENWSCYRRCTLQPKSESSILQSLITC